MLFDLRRHLLAGTTVLAALGAATPTLAAAPKAEDALKLTPIQKEVEFDKPTDAQAAKCTIKAEKVGKQTGWVIRDEAGKTLRRFVDTNGDNVVDLWSYYMDGVEVYRDVDANFNGKSDRYHWLNTGGSRIGLDKDENGRIDAWQTISAEEVSAEIVAALANRDAERFARLLLQPADVKSLGQGEQKSKDLAKKLEGATAGFKTLAGQQTQVTPKSQWVNFSASRPGLVPAGTDGSTKDLLVYENVVAVIDTEDKNSQVQIGTLIKVGDTWRVIDAPKVLGDNDELASTGFFFQTQSVPQTGGDEAADTQNQKMQELLAQLEELDKSPGASPADATKSHAKRADLIEQLASEAGVEADREQWIRQLADTVSAAAQSGEYAEGVERLKKLYDKIEKEKPGTDLAAYVKFRYLTAEYALNVQSPNADFAKIQTEWLDNLEKYVTDHPKSPDTAEALLQLAVAREFSGQEEDAKKWYSKILSDFPTASAAKKASGAVLRLESVGKPIALKGTSTAGKPVDLATQYKGKVVLIHYWATWCEPCKAELPTLKELQAKYGSDGFALIGVSLDTNQAELDEYLKQSKLPWVQIYEPGGLDGRLANELGVLTLPTMILVDQDGKVVDRNIHVSQLETELKKRLVK